MSFIRKVKTASGATAVQVVTKHHGKITNIEHIGSAHNGKELKLLIALAEKRKLSGQQLLFKEEDKTSSYGSRRQYLCNL
jgi:hypothetical protein